ncbi:MAG: hypothetical protein KDG55_15045 [Rhodocyclaceae bacterium]|nr:hypothetical protein [Rhodocyclaceae bacterium]
MAESPELAEIVTEPALDPELAEVVRLRARVARFGTGESDAGDLAGIGRRLVELALPMRARVVRAQLPLPRNCYAQAREMVDAQTACAQHHMRIAQEMRSPYLYGFRGNPEVLDEGLALLADAFETCCVSGIIPPQGFWLAAHGLYLKARAEGAGNAIETYKRLLALSTIQPESFAASELIQVFGLVSALASAGDLVNGHGAIPGQGWFWVDVAQDAPPVAIVRRDPPPLDDLVYFSAASLARAVSERIQKLAGASGDPSDDGGSEREVVSSDEALLRRLRERWAMPPRRSQPRRRSEYSVQVCCGLDHVWERLVRGERASSPPLEWMVQNESPSGFAIMRIAGTGGSLSAGMAIALRREPAAPWSVCVVRWIRSEQPEQVELGLQLVAQAAIPVRVAFRNGPSSKSPVRALVLPPLEAVRRHQAVLAPAGTYAARRFMLMHEGERLYVAQGRLLSLDMQTEAIELFQFEVDPYPI